MFNYGTHSTLTSCALHTLVKTCKPTCIGCNCDQGYFLLCSQVSVIRLLAFDENKVERAERALDLSLLDAVSWPEFVWEYLYMRHDDLRHHRLAAHHC